MNRSRLASVLERYGIATLRFAEWRNEANTAKRDLSSVIEEKGGLAPDQFVQALGEAFHYPVVTLREMESLDVAFDTLPFSEAHARGCVALHCPKRGLMLVFADPFDAAMLGWAQERFNQPIAHCLATPADIASYLGGHEKTMTALHAALPDGLADTRSEAAAEELSLARIAEDKNPVVKLVDSTLYDALQAGASDIHLETDADGLRIKYRIDGVLIRAGNGAIGAQYADQVISRIKVMSGLDIGERRIPQDGRFKVLVRGREVDFRVSIMPSIFGEDAVLRVLDKSKLTGQLNGLRLDSLGFDEATRTALQRLIREPYGMILATGPTGSGKTTTLYAAISEINRGRGKIITIEDPIEYQLPGILQVPVNEKKGLTFARGLRSILRHDPDKIMVGEIRDTETAQIAIQAALTGHLVFTTVHANNVIDVLYRFTYLGVDPNSFMAALNGILAQRLVRIVCEHCKQPFKPDRALLEESRLTEQEATRYDFVRGKGCERCRGTGYKGRVALGELLVMNDEIRESFIAREPIRQLKDKAIKHGTRFLRSSALQLVKEGRTTLREINRVTFVE
jgi:general secretion pathway protein E